MKKRTCILAMSILLAGVSLAASQQIRELGASGPDPNLADKLRLFGQFVGNWDCEVTLIQPDGSKVNGSCQWHFGWILQGSAIQDVWIAHYQGAVLEERGTTRGTTVRWYDPKADLT